MAGSIQTTAQSKAVLDSQEVYRINQPLRTAGDVFELDGSCRALVIGPQSDIANYNVDYYDTQASNRISRLGLSAGAPRIGRLDAYGELHFPALVGSPSAPIIVTPGDLYIDSYTPRGFNENTELIYFEPPYVDLVAMFDAPGSLATAVRANKIYRYGSIFTYGLFTDVWYLVPVYGRRLVTVAMRNSDPVITIDYSIELVRMVIGQGSGVDFGLCPLKQVASGTLGVASDLSQVITASTNGMWDVLQVKLTPSAALARNIASLTIETSDTE